MKIQRADAVEAKAVDMEGAVGVTMRMLIGPDDRCAPRRHDATEQLLHPAPRRLRVGATMLFLEPRPFAPLRRPHRATSPQLRIVEPVDEV